MANIPVTPVTDPKAYPRNAQQSNQDPEHYNSLSLEPWDFIQQNKLDFFEGNVIKYICRYKNKNGIEDLKKAKQYIDMLIAKELIDEK